MSVSLEDALRQVAAKADYRRDVATHGMILYAIWVYEHGGLDNATAATVCRLALDGAVARLRRWEGVACDEQKWHEEHQWSVLIDEEFIDRWCPGRGPKRTRVGKNPTTERQALNDDDLWVSVSQNLPWPGLDED